MASKQSIVSPDRLLGAFCGLSCGKMKFVQVRKDDMAHTVDDAVRDIIDHRIKELKGYEPIDSHGGLVAFRRRQSLPPSPPADGHVPPRPPRSELSVYNPITGQHVFQLPPPFISDEAFVLLANGDGQFLLHVINLELAADGMLQLQTYSSAAGRWGGVVSTYAGFPPTTPSRFLRPTPTLLDGAAYFLCESDSKSIGLHAYAVPIAGQWRPPAPIRLPDEVQHLHAKRRFEPDELLLASSSTVNGRRRLTLAVAKGFTISLWTLDDDDDDAGLVVDPAARWTRSRFVDLWKMKVLKQGCPPLAKRDGDRVKLECFSESSGGAVLFHLYSHLMYKLELKTCKVSLVALYSKRDSSNMCAYDTDEALLDKCYVSPARKPKESYAR
jgi:hypothetical protein